MKRQCHAVIASGSRFFGNMATITLVASVVLPMTFTLGSCKERGASTLQNRPEGGGGGNSPTWVRSPKEGKFLDCKSESAMKKDYLGQLQRHLVYGDLTQVRQADPVGADMSTFYMDNLKNLGIKTNTFASLTEAKLFDGSKGFEFTVGTKKVKPQAGDVLLNFSFGQPHHPGYFYSKRGIAHARLVVGYSPRGELLTFDGGWQGFSKLKQVHSQTIWLRPNPRYIKQGDIDHIVKWAKLMEPVPYDNTLTDDWAEYRSRLHKSLDGGMSQVRAREKALSEAKTEGFAPGESPDSFIPPSGIYCSEGTAAIFAYLGFRMYGETAFDIISKFSRTGELPSWAAYADALSGFGADSDPNTFMMHNLFHSYFSFFEKARKGLISVPGPDGFNGSTAGFAEAMKVNISAAMSDGGASDLLAKQLDEAAEKLAGDAAELEKVVKLKEALLQVAQQTGQLVGANDFNITKAVYLVFFRNLAYGPHSFLENGKYFNLMGVFYNSDLQSGYQAKWISDWWVAPYGQPRQSANISTTLYRLSPEKPGLPDGECVPAEVAPIIRTN